MTMSVTKKFLIWGSLSCSKTRLNYIERISSGAVLDYHTQTIQRATRGTGPGDRRVYTSLSAGMRVTAMS